MSFKQNRMVEQADTLNVAIVGGGPGCKAIMDMIFAEKLSQLRMNLIGVADINPEAIGYQYAREKGIFTTTEYQDLYKLEGLRMIIELTGLEKVADEILRTKPDRVRLMGNVAARLFWDIFRIEEERIAERQRAEEALRKSEHEKEAILNSMSEDVVYYDMEHRIVWANRVASERIGLAPDELVGRHCYEIFHRRSKPCPGCPVVKAREAGQPREAEMTGPDGRIWFVRGIPLRDANDNLARCLKIICCAVMLKIEEVPRIRKALPHVLQLILHTLTTVDLQLTAPKNPTGMPRKYPSRY